MTSLLKKENKKKKKACVLSNPTMRDSQHQDCVSTILKFPPTVHKDSRHPHQHLLFSVFSLVGILMHVRRYLIVVLIYISLTNSDIEHLFICLLAICISSLEKCEIQSSHVHSPGCWVLRGTGGSGFRGNGSFLILVFQSLDHSYNALFLNSVFQW